MTAGTPRQRRLQADAVDMERAFTGHPHVTVIAIEGAPPDSYRVVYRLRGVRLDGRGQPAWSDHHSILLRLGPRYPREAPAAIMETPIFHPNIGSRIGDQVELSEPWTAARTLPEVVAEIGALIQYRLYRTDRPRNPVAARWAADNAHIFPVGPVELSPPA